MLRFEVNDNDIRGFASISKSIGELSRRLGYCEIGSNTRKRFRKVLGSKVYKELASGKRKRLPKNEWTIWRNNLVISRKKR